MAERLDLYFRAHTTPVDAEEEDWKPGRIQQPEHALIFHCATTKNERQDALVGAYICAKL
jgi:hypothetical protein